jgi:hypothetical protein
MIQNHVDLLSGKVHAVPTRAAATAAREMIRDMCLRSGDCFPRVLVADFDPKFTSDVLRGFVHSMGSTLIVGSVWYRKNTNAKVARANGARTAAPLAVFAINNGASTPHAFLHRPLRGPSIAAVGPGRRGGKSPARYARRMRAASCWQGEAGRVDIVFQVEDRVLRLSADIILRLLSSSRFPLIIS